VVACQQERSQHKNRATAMKMLKAALYQRALEEQEAEKAKLESTKTDIGWGSQIRSYVFQPYTMVNDHRTELKVGDVQKVMDGDLDPFIQAYLKEFGASNEETRRDGPMADWRREGRTGRADRLAKLEALRERGVEPYAYASTRRIRRAPRCSALRGGEGDPRVRVAGRIVSCATWGRAPSPTSPTAAAASSSTSAQRAGRGAIRLLDLLDLGDWIGVEGPLFRTRTGEVTVRVERSSCSPSPSGRCRSARRRSTRDR
jgi:hypothetical protein